MRRAFHVLLGAFVVAGCTFSGVKPLLVSPPPKSAPTTLILGEIRVGNPLWESARPHFRRGVSDWYTRNGGFQSVLTEPPAAPVPDSITLTGTITDLDKGSTALRILVGMGAGQAQVKGVFQILGPDGAVLTEFTARESYLGGAGIGGAGLLDMDDLVRRFAETAAETTRKWARGEAIE